jgi:acyl-CoA thioester hydrolase
LPDSPEVQLPPRSGFLAHFRVRYHEMDALGHVNNAVYLHYLEQAAIEHSSALGFTSELLDRLGGLFIARRHEIDYLRPAVVGDLLQVVTWVGEMTGARAQREYLITRRELPEDGRLPADRLVAAGGAAPATPLVRAHTDWVWVGAADHRPRRMPQELRAAFLALRDAD